MRDRPSLQPTDLPGDAAAGARELLCADEAATRRLAEDVAMALSPGDCLCLVGDLGAGKSTFARAVLRALADDCELEVPSPTFTLVQTYDLPRFGVAHFDLYRLDDPDEMEELGLDECLETGVALVEWPERAGARMPADRLAIRLDPVPGEPAARRVTLSWPQGRWGGRLARTFAIRDLLARAGLGGAERRYFQGDASPRRFETVRDAGRRAILMNADPAARPPAPAIRDGLTYAEIVHLSDRAEAVVAVAQALRDRGFAAPALLAAELDAGLVLQEDLGRGRVTEPHPDRSGEERPVAERYAAAMDVLADLHADPPGSSLPLPAEAGAAAGAAWRLPDYDRRALLVEVELFLDWYLPEHGIAADAPMRAAFLELWTPEIDMVLRRPRTWVLRDYHSPNLIWREGATGHDRIGIVDTQDALRGPDAYDVASLAQDARVDVPADLEVALVERYVARRLARDAAFDGDGFRQAYAILAAQRAARILGVFCRLKRRDGKPGYMRHLPRVRDYLARALASRPHTGLADWFAAVDQDLARAIAARAA